MTGDSSHTLATRGTRGHWLTWRWTHGHNVTPSIRTNKNLRVYFLNHPGLGWGEGTPQQFTVSQQQPGHGGNSGHSRTGPGPGAVVLWCCAGPTSYWLHNTRSSEQLAAVLGQSPVSRPDSVWWLHDTDKSHPASQRSLPPWHMDIFSVIHQGYCVGRHASDAWCCCMNTQETGKAFTLQKVPTCTFTIDSKECFHLKFGHLSAKKLRLGCFQEFQLTKKLPIGEGVWTSIPFFNF